MSVESGASESVESLLAFTVDKRQRNAEAASPELRKEAILSNTVRRAHQMLSIFDPTGEEDGEFKARFDEDELIDVDDEIDENNLENLSPDEILETTSSKEKMAGLIQEMNLSSLRIKRKRPEDPLDGDDELSDSFFVPSPRKKGKTTSAKTPNPEDTMGKLSLMDT
jgi:hypothetical protein